MAKDKFLLVSLKDDEAKTLASVIQNDTARRILDHLADNEATETQISQALEIPLPTVHYNLQALLKANLVVADQFHYSPKGREVNHYKLANKYIIIAPQSAWGLKEKLKSLLPVVPIVGGAALALEWASRAFGTSAAGSSALRMITDAAPEAMQKSAAIPSAVPAFASQSAGAAAPSAAPLAAPAVAPMAADQAVRSVAQAGSGALEQEAIAQVTHQGVPTAVQAAGQASGNLGSTILSHPGIMLVIGALIAICAYFITDYLKSRR